MALSSRAHAFSVEVLVGSSAKHKLRDLEEERSEKEAEGTVRRSQAPEKKRKGEMPAAASLSEETREAAGEIQVDLQGSELWKRFHEIGTEMIITKAGRRMFPSVRVKVKGLDPLKQYYIAIDVVPVDSKRYRYVYHSSQWMVAGNTDHSCITPRLYIHPDSPCSGETWMRQIISFDRVKLTNNEMDDKGHIILQSMHKYKPRVHVIVQDSRFDLSQIQSLPAAGVQTFSFKETEFTTVTAYQNQQITKLKIDRNPFAKGFRDPGRNRGVLDGLLESYPWRPSLTLDFKPFGAETQGRSPGSSPVTPNGGTPSPLNALLSPSCSPPTFHLSASNLGVTCPDAYLHHLSLPICYKLCPTGLLRPPSLMFPSHEKLGSATSPHLLPHFMVEMPTLSSLSIASVKHGKVDDLNGQNLQRPSSAGHMLYGLHASGNIFPSGPITRDALNCALHPPYGFYGYNLSVPSRLMNTAGHFKANDSIPSPIRESRCHHPHWPSTMNHCL
ncbi:T-box transcription factor TBX22 [Hemicordylus capensis]|uniref:T-box transcription factor TBX22 n=1 Tax=Hemicordylus capensis TaxID=884348 RepID=UPI002302BA28|nr:T-box transcription factor TBX22 [Hemicordylus capensis]